MTQTQVESKIKIERLKDVESLMPELLKLYIKSYQGLEEYAYTDPSSIRRYFRWLFRHDPQGFFLAKDKNRIVGFIAVDATWISHGEKVGEIHELAVDPDQRGKGIAKMLIEEAFRYFKNKGLKKSGLWVGEHNRGAQHLYRKLGFEECYTKGIWIIMEKKL